MHNNYDPSITYNQPLLEEEEYRDMKAIMGEYEIEDTAELNRLIEQGKNEAVDAIKLLREVRAELIAARKSTLKYGINKALTHFYALTKTRSFWIHVSSVLFLALSLTFILNYADNSANQSEARQEQSRPALSTK